MGWERGGVGSEHTERGRGVVAHRWGVEANRGRLLDGGLSGGACAGEGGREGWFLLLAGTVSSRAAVGDGNGSASGATAGAATAEVAIAESAAPVGWRRR